MFPDVKKIVLSIPQKSEDKHTVTSAKHIVQSIHNQALREICGLVNPSASSPLPCELGSKDTWVKPGSTQRRMQALCAAEAMLKEHSWI